MTARFSISGPRGKHAEQGFTLIEMLVVLTIIGIVAAVALTGFHRPAYLDRGKVHAALAAAAATARLEAQAGGKPVQLDLHRDQLAGLDFRSDPGFQDAVPTFYPDGSSNAGIFSLRGQEVARLDWATGQLGDAAQ